MCKRWLDGWLNALSLKDFSLNLAYACQTTKSIHHHEQMIDTSHWLLLCCNPISFSIARLVELDIEIEAS